jgi:uncharacterized protein YecA (UPF0149 family)
MSGYTHADRRGRRECRGADAGVVALALQQVPAGEPQPAQPMRRFGSKIGRNDPCPCGSGKKYKQCHGQLG